MNKIKKIFTKFPFLKFFLNKYVLITIFFCIWLLFLDNYSYIEHRILNKEIDELESNLNFYQNEITKDSIQIQQFKNSNHVEKYAREKYYMKQENEDIYIIEFEEDKKAKIEAEKELESKNN